MDGSTEKSIQTVSSVAEFLEQQQKQDLLRFITCGSVDDGKSTLIGRLLWESKSIFDDQLAALQADSRRHGTQGQEIDFALLVDGLAAEREQGITIDVAYRFFASPRRKFIVADTPGHEQYTRNMITGASTADVAILLVDASQGLQVQTRRHAYLVSLVGIKNVVLAVNKMDLVGFENNVFNQIRADFLEFAKDLGFDHVTAIPLSALKGDNVTARSGHMGWYNGPTLMGYLDTAKVGKPDAGSFVFPVQMANRADSSFRGFCGTGARGAVAVGDVIRVTRTGQTATVSEIVTMDGNLNRAEAGDAVTLKLASEVDVSRGDVLSLQKSPLETTDQFEATLVWMNEESGFVGRNYQLKLATQWVNATITGIKYRVDPNTLSHDACKQLALNDICVCTISTTTPVTAEAYASSKALGGFILVDRFNHATVAAGMVRHSLRRAQNVHKQMLSITREDRERQNGHKGKVLWFTGLSGSGKSTVANALEVALHARGQRTYILDGDNLRHGLNKDLGFTDADRIENVRRVGEVAKLMMDAGIVVLASFISPFRREREMVRELVGADNFVEIYANTPLATCEERDPKGLYKKARSGGLPNMTGIGSPYEPPVSPDFEFDSTLRSAEDVANDLILFLGS
jgi:bifunctional enzyme CysN/CysC